MRILILEDDPIIALDLQMLVEYCGYEDVVVCETVAQAQDELTGIPDFAFLDVDLPDGKSYDIAALLDEYQVPYAFVSGSRSRDLPDHLRHARFISKPYHHAVIRNALTVRESVAC